jgi:hypothetical protein
MANIIEDALLGMDVESDIKSDAKTDWIAFYKEQFDKLKKEGEDSADKFYKTKVDGKPMSHGLSEYAGKFSHPGYGELEVVADESSSDPENRLSIKFHSAAAKLTHMHYDIFYAYLYEMPLPASFKTALDGTIESISIQFEPGLEEFILFKRAPKPEGEKK